MTIKEIESINEREKNIDNELNDLKKIRDKANEVLIKNNSNNSIASKDDWKDKMSQRFTYVLQAIVIFAVVHVFTTIWISSSPPSNKILNVLAQIILTNDGMNLFTSGNWVQAIMYNHSVFIKCLANSVTIIGGLAITESFIIKEKQSFIGRMLNGVLDFIAVHILTIAICLGSNFDPTIIIPA